MRMNNSKVKKLNSIGFWLILICIILFTVALIINIIALVSANKSEAAMFNDYFLIMKIASILIAAKLLISRILISLSLIGASQLILLWLNKNNKSV
ncbi:hypothetical protein [Orenia marismortui]|uniref:hypothetical protein n=1 Tax=Orenia marismortui TaxID=46469 RepID=UPI0003639391|nr:hypothetical protein [Orenia marismortui]